MRTAGFILVGGRSSRMGQDKALLPWRSRTFLDHIADKVRAAAGSVTLVGNSAAYRDMHMDSLADLHPGLGPLAGIEAALSSGLGDLNLIVACDLPLIETEWLTLLLATAQSSEANCIIAKGEDGRIHPLCGVYRPECLPAVRKALEEGRLKLMDILGDLPAEYGPVAGPIWNVNTPEEWRRCQEFAHGR